MAKNLRAKSGSGYVAQKVDLGTSGSSGDVTLVSEMPVYLLEDTDSGDEATCMIIGCHIVVDVSVTGANNAGNSAVAVGNAIYDDSGTLNKDATNGTFVGYALETVSSGGTSTIKVAM